MGDDMKDPAKSRKYGDFSKAPDLRTHIRVVEVEGKKVVEFRDHIPSLGENGRGYWIPLTKECVGEVIAALQEVVKKEKLA